jgi:microcystin-dependent protein
VTDPGHQHPIVHAATGITMAVIQDGVNDGTVSNRWHLADGVAGLVTQSGTTGITIPSSGGGTSGSAGSGGAHGNMPPFMTLTYLIRL